MESDPTVVEHRPRRLPAPVIPACTASVPPFWALILARAILDTPVGTHFERSTISD